MGMKKIRRARKRGVRRLVTRLVIRLAKPYIPGLVASATARYFFDSAAGPARRQKAIGLLSRGKATA
jgi:hypothetical protein